MTGYCVNRAKLKMNLKSRGTTQLAEHWARDNTENKEYNKEHILCKYIYTKIFSEIQLMITLLPHNQSSHNF